MEGAEYEDSDSELNTEKRHFYHAALLALRKTWLYHALLPGDWLREDSLMTSRGSCIQLRPCCRAASVIPPWNSRCKIELIFGVMLQFNVVWCIRSRREIVLTIQSDNGKQGYKVGGKKYRRPKVVLPRGPCERYSSDWIRRRDQSWARSVSFGLPDADNRFSRAKFKIHKFLCQYRAWVQGIMTKIVPYYLKDLLQGRVEGRFTCPLRIFQKLAFIPNHFMLITCTLLSCLLVKIAGKLEWFAISNCGQSTLTLVAVYSVGFIFILLCLNSNTVKLQLPNNVKT